MPFQFLYSCALNNSVHTHLLRRGKYHCRMDSTISLHTNNNILSNLVKYNAVKLGVSRTVIHSPTVSVVWLNQKGPF